MKPYLYARLKKEDKETIEKALELMNWNNGTNTTMNDLIVSKMLTWAKRYLRS